MVLKDCWILGIEQPVIMTRVLVGSTTSAPAAGTPSRPQIVASSHSFTCSDGRALTKKGQARQRLARQAEARRRTHRDEILRPCVLNPLCPAQVINSHVEYENYHPKTGTCVAAASRCTSVGGAHLLEGGGRLHWRKWPACC